MKCKSEKGFVIGDPCYILEDNIYDDIWGKQNQYKDGEIPVKDNLSFCVSGTAYGDGCYDFDCSPDVEVDSNFRGFGVDSGTLAVIPVELVRPDYYKDSVFNGWINKPGEVELDYENGIFYFTHSDGQSLKIYTGDTDYDEEDEEDYSYNEWPDPEDEE